MKKSARGEMVLRLLIASLVASIVTAACLTQSADGAAYYYQLPQLLTRKKLKVADSAIRAYRQKKGVLPQSLSQLSEFPDQAPPIENDGAVWDSWMQPLVYEVHRGGYLLISLGRDGKKGGVGLDCDLSSVNSQPPEAQMPFIQIISQPRSRPMILWSIISGAMAFALSLRIMVSADLSRQHRITLVTKLLVTLAASILVALFITAVHIPSGH